ncbi:MAG: hypothetical protein WBP29_01270 [Candidatus Zixiibacteriota bacterium]
MFEYWQVLRRGANFNWEAVERDETPERKRIDNPIFDVLKKEFCRGYK